MNKEETSRVVYLNLKILFETVDGPLRLSSDSCNETACQVPYPY